eukprot:TRINITY_DN11476_c0_g1_i2.p1 TRINITY_DN11476_c0_g1~~TRINITY_DN11476_c0_g1_i2.p1  ORF type:complete len:1845 (-),score=356.21 TRINITY_DN11476_c0_g1_i2:119-5653(-)
MGKQKGEGGRTKTRPSSSSLAASLLRSGATTVGFGGYVGSSRLEPSVSSREDSVPLADIDGEVAQHLKRLGRKDPTTKLKALASLCILFKEKPGEVVHILPQWVFEYKRLLLDYNRDVRRATHDAMTNLVSTVGRGLAPHLKSLMGPWWFSQFDPIHEVSQAARRSFQTAFPAQERRLDALILCASEIFLYLDENLKLTPQAMSDKAVPMDELDDMHQRVISSSLLAITTLIDILLGLQSERPDFDKATTDAKHASRAKAVAISSAEKMFSSHKYFLEFLKSQSPGVRSATYSVLGCFIKHIPHAYNEGNMKILSAAILGAFQEKDPACHSSMWDVVLLFSKRFPDSWHLSNIQKTVLTRFWHFLKKGCHGSQEVSYPTLVLFLDTIPPKSINGEQFLLSFFQNLWAGRNPFHSLSDDRLTFFNALKECFLWGIYNASRFSKDVNTVGQLQVSLIDNVLVMLLWHDYLSVVSSKNQVQCLSEDSNGLLEVDVQPSDEGQIETLNIKYPQTYIHDLAKCIVEILSDISTKECGLLSAFSASFQKDCLDILHRADTSQKSSGYTEEIVNFLFLVEKHSVQKGESWPLVYLAQPMLETFFPFIKSMDCPDGMRLLAVVAEIFGPQTIVSKFFVSGKEHPNCDFVDGDNELKSKLFLQVFKDDVIPCCLHGNYLSSSSCIDLLLALLDNELFLEQWDSIISYATQLEGCSTTEAGYSDIGRVGMLAMLMEKVRIRIENKKLGICSNNFWGSPPECWNHDLLNSAAISIVCRSPPFHASHIRFLRAVLAGSSEDEQTCFLSREAVMRIFDELLKNFITLLMQSDFSWAKHVGSLIVTARSDDLMDSCKSSFIMVLDAAKFALEVLEGSFYCLKLLDDDCTLIPCILGAIFSIEWECNMTNLKSIEYNANMESSVSTSEIIDFDAQAHVESKLALSDSFYAFRCKISTQFWKGLSYTIRQKLGCILVQVIRSAVFDIDILFTDQASLCCKWVQDVLQLICLDHDEEQSILDQLLSEREFWPMWVAPIVKEGRRSATVKVATMNADIHEAQQHHQFVAFVQELISSLGFSRIIAGSVLSPITSSVEEAPTYLVPSFTFSRGWLAAEMICSWKWHGGSALVSLLPYLTGYAKTLNSSLEDNLVYSLVNTLLDGALVQGATGQRSFFNAWTVTDDEVDNIQDPFLRGLVSILSSLMINGSTWGKDEASTLFTSIINKLFIGTTVNKSCLRILPSILNVLIQPLRIRSTGGENLSDDVPHDPTKEESVHDIVVNWLQTALSSPPLVTWQAGEHDFEEWVRVALSCFPLSKTGGIGTLKMALSSNVSQAEKTLLLGLFRKHRCDNASMMPLSVSLETTLSRLIAVSVGYCWQEFDENDWGFVLSQLRRWIESVVVLMEEIAENVDSLTNASSSNNLEALVSKLENVVHILDPSLMDIARTALFILTLFCGLSEQQQPEDAEISQQWRAERWEPLKERILEGVFRLFFATGVAEAIASSYGEEASSVVSSARLSHSHFWELVASSVIHSPHDVRNTAAHSLELWGLSKGPISSLYAILFSTKVIPSIQVAAYIFLSTEPICSMAITNGNSAGNREIGPPHHIESSVEEPVLLRAEISDIIERPPAEILEMDFVSQYRVNAFIAWALLLTHIQSLPPSSPARERLIQRIQDYASSAILDCLFQHIPLKLGSALNMKKKDVELPMEASKAAAAAKRAITTCSLLFAVESLWPVGTEQMATLSGAIYGLMLCLLPAYVRNWFTSLRDRPTSSAIEFFTKVWCSPPLLADELSKIRDAVVVDENFSVSVSKSAYEVIATYEKEESGMDLVIRLPSCYPLRPVDVDCTRSLGISEVKQRKW